MDYGKSFTFVFDDEEWMQKILIGGILSLIPIVNLVTVGYGLRVLKNVAEGAEKPLPKWDDFGDFFGKGLMSVLGALVWALPVIFLSFLSAIISAATGYSTDPQYVSAPVNLCISGFGCLSGLYGLFLALVIPAATSMYAVTGEFGAFFRFSDIFRYITKNLGPYLIALLLGAVAGFVGGLGVILCCIGVVFTGFWATLVGSYLLGGTYGEVEPAT
jgi:hypothetical protein